MSRKSKPLRVSAPSREPKHEDSKPTLVPKLRFPEFRGTKGWELHPLGPMTTKVGSGITPTGGEKNYKKAGRPFVRSQNVGWGALLLDDVAHIDEATHQSFDSSEIAADDVLLNITGASIGRSSMAIARIVGGNVNQHVCIIRLNRDELHPLLLNQYLISESGQAQIDSFQAGGNRQGLNFAQIRSFTIPVPPSLEEQQKIAECLSSVDELMAAQARKVDAIKTHKKGLMQQLFPREGETQPRLRFPEFQNAGEWIVTTVGGLIEGGILFPPKDGNHGNMHPKSSDYVANGIPFIMASDLNGGLIDIENCHFITKEQADTLQKGFAKEGDVLLSHKGTVGEVAVVRKINTPFLMLTPQVTYYRVKDHKQLLNEFMAQLFVAETFQSNLLQVSGGGTRAYIGITEQAKLRMQLPKQITEQKRIASCLSSLDALITAETQKLEALKTHKKALMQQLFPSPEEVDG